MLMCPLSFPSPVWQYLQHPTFKAAGGPEFLHLSAPSAPGPALFVGESAANSPLFAAVASPSTSLITGHSLSSPFPLYPPAGSFLHVQNFPFSFLAFYSFFPSFLLLNQTPSRFLPFPSFSRVHSHFPPLPPAAFTHTSLHLIFTLYYFLFLVHGLFIPCFDQQTRPPLVTTPNICVFRPSTLSHPLLRLFNRSSPRMQRFNFPPHLQLSLVKPASRLDRS